MPESIEEAIQSEFPAAALLADEDIVARVLDGDLASFEQIMRRYNQRLFRVARSIVGDDNETEDVLQETYVSAFEHLAQFAGRAKFSTWLTRIAVNAAIARRLRRSRMRAVDFNDPENTFMVPRTEASAEQQASVRELGKVLTNAVDALPEDLRVVFALRMIQGLDTHESAGCLQLTESNVKVRLHRARTILRDHIDEQIGVEVRQLYEFGGERCDRIVRTVLARLLALREQ